VEIKQRLREAREAMGFTKADLARKADLTPAAISQFESGEREPSLDSLKRLAHALHVGIDYLVGRKEETITDMHMLFRNLKDISDKDKEILLQVYERLKKTKIE
jgi:transcriptional regulator with XRE-family HTH domain